jgi:hypothetical protein
VCRPAGLPTPGQQAALAPWLSDSRRLPVREGAGYVIDDIGFAGAGPFSPLGRLRDALDRSGE